MESAALQVASFGGHPYEPFFYFIPHLLGVLDFLFGGFWGTTPQRVCVVCCGVWWYNSLQQHFGFHCAAVFRLLALRSSYGMAYGDFL